ncbi:MAG: hypothetical protein ACNI26_06035 [Terasakiella sp.]|uniref:hypothetical protein n=1 Tax=unclassified Terasakiella TaxID=2614952 RepID=UPI003AFFC35D
MRNIVIGLVIGLVVGVVLGVTVLTPKIKSHAASKAVLKDRELTGDNKEAPVVLSALQDGDAIHWRSAPPFPTDHPNVSAQAQKFSKQLSLLSGDKMILPILPAKDVIGADRLFNAIASGRIDALFSTADIAADKEPALSLFSAIPFGPNAVDMMAWLQVGNGTLKLKNIFSKHNVTALVCGYLPPEASGWFVNELQNADQISDLRIRVTGLGAKVWAKAGAKVNEMTAEEVPNAFDQGQLDGAIFSSPSQDVKSGYSRYAKNYYFPGWQNQGQPLFLLINTRAWKRLDQERQSLLKTSCDQRSAIELAKAPQEQFKGLSELIKQDVILRRMPSYILDPLKQAWEQVLAEEVRKDQSVLEIWESLNAFLKNRTTWQEMSRLKDDTNDF